jgi:hypothetical protein
MESDPRQAEQPLSVIVDKLSADLKQLAREERELAGRELGEKLDAAKAQATTLALGGAAVFGGALTLLAAIVLGLAVLLPAWIAALIVAVPLVAGGGILIATGASGLSRISIKPQQTLANMRRDVAAIKEAARG